jgi:hypothetical protein
MWPNHRTKADGHISARAQRRINPIRATNNKRQMTLTLISEICNALGKFRRS